MECRGELFRSAALRHAGGHRAGRGDMAGARSGRARKHHRPAGELGAGAISPPCRRCRGRMMPHGWLILDKPRGLGSTQAVGAVKRVLRQAGYVKGKVGPGGPLDPRAEGVLPIALGEATKLCGRMLDSAEISELPVGFGEETGTLGMEEIG